jgi:hypothetical protein
MHVRAHSLLRWTTAACTAAALAAAPLGAQRVEGTRAGAAAPAAPAARARDTVVTGPPLSPRRAFLYSALLPGFGQARLERYNAGALFVAVEMASVAMAVKSRAGLRQAERLYRDSVVVGYNPPDSAGVIRPTFQRCLTSRDVQQPCRLTQERVRARRVHYEDWLAALLFNHLFAGADAFVAAQLWDLPTQVSASPDGRGVTVAARVAW